MGSASRRRRQRNGGRVCALRRAAGQPTRRSRRRDRRCESVMIGVGQKVGSCEVLQLLGRGGIGDVYAGIDRTLERTVAIKVLRPEFGQEPGFIDRFRAEAKSLAQLNHPNIATLYSLHVDERALCMIMELVPGRTLEEIIADAGRLSERDSLAVIAQATEGLACAHKGGIVHRDVKPANMMVTADGVAEDHRLRHRPHARREAAHPARPDRRHGGLHGAGANSRRHPRRAHRHLQPRHRAL